MGRRGARFVDCVLIGQLAEHLREPVGSTAAEICFSAVGSLPSPLRLLLVSVSHFHFSVD